MYVAAHPRERSEPEFEGKPRLQAGDMPLFRRPYETSKGAPRRIDRINCEAECDGVVGEGSCNRLRAFALRARPPPSQARKLDTARRPLRYDSTEDFRLPPWWNNPPPRDLHVRAPIEAEQAHHADGNEPDRHQPNTGPVRIRPRPI